MSLEFRKVSKVLAVHRLRKVAREILGGVLDFAGIVALDFSAVLGFCDIEDTVKRSFGEIGEKSNP